MKHVLFSRITAHLSVARLSILPLGIVAECARFVKVSFIVGSQAAFFSLGHCITPLVGFYAGMGMSLLLLGLRSLFTGLTLHLPPHLALAYHIPSMCAAFYMATIAQAHVKQHHRIMMALLIAVCFLAFGLHPVGSHALSYTLFWFIPLCSSLISHKNTFFHALASTFTAHAVGSVVWLYSVGPVTPAAWLALIPVVVVERLLFASGMTACIATVAAVHKAVALRRKNAHESLSL